MHKVREAMTLKLEHEMLSGFVEIDDALYGGRIKGKPGRALQNKRQVVVMVERLQFGAGDAAFAVMHNQSAGAFKLAVEKHLEPMSHIRTDGYPHNGVLYNLGKLDMTTIGHVYSEDGPLKNVDRVISLSKRFLLGTYHQFCARAHLKRFLAEYLSDSTSATSGVNFSAELSQPVLCVRQCRMLQYPETQVFRKGHDKHKAKFARPIAHFS